MRTAWMCAVLIACGSSGGTVDGGADTGTDGQPNLDAGLDSAVNGSHPTPPTCTTLGTLPMRTPTYFVDFSGGSDASDGKSQGTAFKHAPGDTNATGNAASVTLAPGDVVLLKGGLEYDGTITLTTSGTAQAPIVLEGGAQQGWGSGTAIVDGQTTRALGIAVTNASYVIVEGFEVRNFDKTQSSTGISVDGGSNDVVVGNVLHDIYYATNPGGTSWEQQRGTGISVNNSPGTNVYANAVRDCGNAGISLSADGASVTGGTTACNEVTNMNWGIVAALGDSDPGHPPRRSHHRPQLHPRLQQLLRVQRLAPRRHLRVRASRRRLTLDRRHRDRGQLLRRHDVAASARPRGSTSSSCARTSTCTTTSSTSRAPTSAFASSETGSRWRATTCSRTTSSRTRTGRASYGMHMHAVERRRDRRTTSSTTTTRATSSPPTR